MTDRRRAIGPPSAPRSPGESGESSIATNPFRAPRTLWTTAARLGCLAWPHPVRRASMRPPSRSRAPPRRRRTGRRWPRPPAPACLPGAGRGPAARRRRRRPGDRPAAVRPGRGGPRRAGGPDRPPVRREVRRAARPAAGRGGPGPVAGRRPQRGQVPAAGQPDAEGVRGGALQRLAAPAAGAPRPAGGRGAGPVGGEVVPRPAHRAGRRPRGAARGGRAAGVGHLPPVRGDPLRPERRTPGRAPGRPDGRRPEPVVTPERRLPTPEDTRALGAELAGLLRAGDLVVLVGPLGAGKTALTQGIGQGLGVREPVTSPTFVIARVHTGGRLPLVHVDAYRLGSVADVDDLDLDASTEESVTVVEWGQGLVEQLADEHLEVRLDRRDGDVRTAVLVPHGPSWEERLAVVPEP